MTGSILTPEQEMHHVRTYTSVLGARDDAAASGDGSIVAILKYLRELLSGTLSITFSDDWESAIISDLVDNDSDKTFIVPSGYNYQILNVWVEYFSTATVGNRQLVVEIQDAIGERIAQMRAGAVQAASTTSYYNLAPALVDLEDFRDTNFLSTPVPPTWILPSTYRVRIYDKAAIAASADDMHVKLWIARKQV